MFQEHPMTTFQVWAPEAQEVEIELNGKQRLPMQRAEGGWWRIDVAEAGIRTDYAFSIDGKEPFPDPRSAWQPEGVHGASRVVDHADFPWTDQRWQPRPLGSSVIYELHIGTFTPGGTFGTAIEKLDHLVDLGITHVEIMPVAEFSGSRGWGYDGVDLYAPHHAYGGPSGLKKLVNACHEKGLAVILDVVYNHFGPDGNYLGQYGPYYTSHHTTAWGDAVNLDGPGSDEVRHFFIDNALMWLRDYHIDGLRLDAVHAIVDDSALNFLEELTAAVKHLEIELGRHLFLIAESDLNNPRVVQPPEVGGYGNDAQWCDDFHHALHALLTGEQDGYYMDFGDWNNLAKALTQGFVYDGCFSAFRGRKHGRSPGGVPAHRFVSYLQNHDQIGNRAEGDRINHLVDTDLVKIGAAIVLTSPLIPMLFQGEEWGASTPFQYFTNFEDRALGQAVSEGRRSEFSAFGWDPEDVPDPQALETFERSKLKWEEIADEPHTEILEWHRQLIRLRRELPDLGSTGFDQTFVAYDEEARWMAIQRGAATVIFNLAEETQTISLEYDEHPEVRLTSKPGVSVDADGVEIPGATVAILAGQRSKNEE
jgi:maltooligosyltrehalose trehalohydrolase